MKRLALLSLLCATLAAQTVQITVMLGKSQKSWDVLLGVETVLAAFTCTASELKAGEFTDCTITLNQAVRGMPAVVTVKLPTGFTGPSSVTIVAGTRTATFRVTRSDVIASGPIFPVTYAMRVPGCEPQRFADVLTACCARADKCGLSNREIAWEPCAE